PGPWLIFSVLVGPVIKPSLGALGLAEMILYQGNHPDDPVPHLLDVLDDASMGSWLLLSGLLSHN
ncbi:MAG: hypothetical protein ACRCT2_13315, partial [Plesiomonas shigelloides]